MNRTLISRLFYTLAALLLVVSVGVGFSVAHRLHRPTPANVSEFVCNRLPPQNDASSETWFHQGIPVRLEGLSRFEHVISHGKLRLWRHGLAPATSLTVGPHDRPLTVQWEFYNPLRDQELVLRLDGAPLRTQALAFGRNEGQIELAPAPLPTCLRMEFSRTIQPPQDPRRLTATFRTLRIVGP